MRPCRRTRFYFGSIIVSTGLARSWQATDRHAIARTLRAYRGTHVHAAIQMCAVGTSATYGHVGFGDAIAGTTDMARVRGVGRSESASGAGPHDKSVTTGSPSVVPVMA